MRQGSLLLLLAMVLAEGCSGPGSRPSAPPSAPPAAPFVEAVLLEGPPPMKGLMAEGRAGDWMLRNERITIVVRGPRDAESFPEETGLLVDAAPAGGVDLLREIAIVIGEEGGRPPRVESVERRPGSDSTDAVLVLKGRVRDLPGLRVETRISLESGSNVVTLDTRLVNEGSSAIQQLPVAERILWGRAKALVPGVTSLGPEAVSLPFVAGFGAGSGEDTGYAWLGPRGGEWGTGETSRTRIELGRIDLPPAGEASFPRRFLVYSGSGAEALDAAWKARGTAVAEVEVRVHGTGSRKNSIEGSRITLLDEAGTAFATGATGASGVARLFVPPGHYRARAVSPGRGEVLGELVEARVGSEARVALVLPEPARVGLSARSEAGGTVLPARWSFFGTDGTPDPDFGPPDRGPAVANVVFGTAAIETIEVPPGTYRLVASRGPAFQSWETSLNLEEGKETAVEALLPPVGLPPGWWSADLHVRTFRSRGCTVSLEDRSSALQCDGIEAIVVADVGWRSDPDPGPLLVIPGEEIHTEEGGRFTTFPVRSDPSRPGQGALNPFIAEPSSALVSLLVESPAIRLQVVQPPWPDSLRIEFFELMTPDTPTDFGRRWDAWIELLRRGRRVVATGGSHRGLLVEGEAGNPRTWIGFDSTLVTPRTEDVLAALEAGRVVVSKGPFIHFTLDGEEVGSTLTRSAGMLRGRVEVFAPSGIVVNRVTVYVNGVEDAVFLIGNEDRPLRFSEDIEVNLKGSAFVVVTVEGRGRGSPGVPPVAAGGETRPIAPLAISNPIRVEIFRASG